MLKFFRQIRQQNLNQGEIKKYFIYAIGEILLVVIGILIALQINTWNNNRIDRQLEKQYLNRMVQDLNADLNELESVINITRKRLILGAKVLDTLGTNNIYHWDAYQDAIQNYPNVKSLLSMTFGNALVDTRMYRLFVGTDITLQELLSNGKLDIIKDTPLKVAIQNHYNNVQYRKNLQLVIKNAREGYVAELIANGISMRTEQTFDELQPQIKDRKTLIAHLDNILTLAWGDLNHLRGFENSVEKSTINLIAEIDRYLQSLN